MPVIRTTLTNWRDSGRSYLVRALCLLLGRFGGEGRAESKSVDSANGQWEVRCHEVLFTFGMNSSRDTGLHSREKREAWVELRKPGPALRI